MSLHSLSLRRRHQSGITLILVLSFVLLLTAVVLVFLSRALIARQLSSGSLRQSSADQFALSSLDVVTGNLKQEIASPTLSSSGTYNSTYVVYRPLSSTNAVPICFVNPAFVPSSAPNLLRISSHLDNGQSFPSSLASAVNSTTDASVNGRSVTLPRWNSHYLLPVQNSATANTDSTPTCTFTPDWVFVTDTGGPTVITAPNSSVIGRYAYAIYDEGGLLDVNVAGYPSKSTTAQYGDKPALAYADLTQLALPATPTVSLLTTTDVDNLVGWRNYASVQPTGSFGSFAMTTAGQTQSFFNLIANNVSGFLTVNPATYNNLTDQAFLSRQQLIKYIASTGTDTNSHANSLHNALQYLGTFSRDVNAPSWIPSTPSGSTIDYYGQKDSTTSTNRDILGVRVITAFTRADGTTAQVGEPLVKYRFPLNRLQGITYQGIDSTDTTTLAMTGGTRSPASAQTIQRDFGLVWTNGDSNADPLSPSNASYPNADISTAKHWNYCGPTGTTTQPTIATLEVVRSQNREPNFFELLKAAILSGSLGRDAGLSGEWYTNYEEGPASGMYLADQDVDAQVIQLGANIIDQSDTDSYPTEIHFIAPGKDGTNVETAFYGIENLPYIQRVFSKVLNHYTDTFTSPSINGEAGWYMAELWNPHQNACYPADTSTIPTQFRYGGDGASEIYLPSFPGQHESNPTLPQDGYPITSSIYYLENSGYLQFSNAVTGCREPTFLCNDTNNQGQGTPTVIVPTLGPGPNGGSNGNGTTFATGTITGLYSGVVTIPSGDPNGTTAAVFPQNCNLYLEYLDANGNWRIYDRMRNLSAFVPWGGDPSPQAFYFGHADPRTDRLGTSFGQWTYSGSVHPPGQSIRQDRGQGSVFYDYFPNVNSGFHYPAGTESSPGPIYNNFFLGTLSDNVSSTTVPTPGGIVSNPYYSDPDGIVRPAQGAYSTDAYGDFPLVSSATTGNYNPRPIILNRPFRNVGELGYAFRDEPWKNVDFFTSGTGDAGLLDFFCINESTTATPMVAGTVNLNTRQAPVLQAILAGATRDETGNASSPGTTPILSTEAASIASSIVSWTQSSSAGKGPFQYRGDLLTKAASTLVVNNTNTWQQEIKIQREAALRALSDAGTTRTWTLLVDLVAQVGHYPPGATSLKQFVVDGEKRYWLHITLDRYTGQVIDRQLEPVYE